MSRLTELLDPDHDGRPELPADLERLLAGFGRAALLVLAQYLAAEIAKLLAHANPGNDPTRKDSTQDAAAAS